MAVLIYQASPMKIVSDPFWSAMLLRRSLCFSQRSGVRA